jgi:MoaA/NifB/PqqE/SkfB family radical SAM enzyme
MRHAFNIVRLLTNPRVVGPPLRLFRRLCRENIEQVPDLLGDGTKDGLWRRQLRALEFIRRWLRSEGLTRHRGQWVINSFMPPFPGPAYERMFEKLQSGQRLRPHSAFLALTADCPADCWHCSLKNRRPAPPLSTSQWLDVIAQLNHMRISLIGLTGGEPLTRADLPDLIRAAAEGGAAAELFTSGIGLTEEKIITLRDAGLWAVGVSLDHTQPDVVNRMRRTPKAFDAAVATLEMSTRAGLYTFINTMAHREMVASGEHRRLYDLARSLNIHELRLIEPMPCGRLASDGRNCFLQSSQVAELRRFHRDTNRRGRGPKVCAFNEMESPELFGCGAGTYHLFVDPSGEVCPCDFAPLSFGNVRNEPLDSIYRRMSDAMHQPRRSCLVQTSVALIGRHTNGRDLPLPPEVSHRIASELPKESLPDYFQRVVEPFGFFLG